MHRMLSLGPRLAVIAALTIGLAFGLGAFTFTYARGYSYLSNDPGACANCHIMREHLDAWHKSTHRAVATCNSCHTPASIVGKYTTKARNGFWHSYYFTTGRFPDPLRITERNRSIAEASCRKCHQPMVEAIEGPIASGAAHASDQTSCIRCHRYVGHYVR